MRVRFWGVDAAGEERVWRGEEHLSDPPWTEESESDDGLVTQRGFRALTHMIVDAQPERRPRWRRVLDWLGDWWWWNVTERWYRFREGNR